LWKLQWLEFAGVSTVKSKSKLFAGVTLPPVVTAPPSNQLANSEGLNWHKGAASEGKISASADAVRDANAKPMSII
jgi:hypothetical protein